MEQKSVKSENFTIMGTNFSSLAFHSNYEDGLVDIYFGPEAPKGWLHRPLFEP